MELPEPARRDRRDRGLLRSQVGPTRHYSPYGESYQALVDNAPDDYDVAWTGRRFTEHAPGLTDTIEMGARLYSPQLGRFLEVDPVEGGSANDYEYAAGDPVNNADLTGMCSGFVRCLNQLRNGFFQVLANRNVKVGWCCMQATFGFSYAASQGLWMMFDALDKLPDAYNLLVTVAAGALCLAVSGWWALLCAGAVAVYGRVLRGS